jgi:hypothetical protein
MDAVRLGQAEDLRAALRRAGPRTVTELSAEAVLSVWSVKCRLAERPDWFRCVGEDRWELVT